MAYLKAGEAVIGMRVCVERSRNKLLMGRIVAIEEQPSWRTGKARRCRVHLRYSRQVREYEDRLLIG